MNVVKLVRSSEWWEYKLPPLLAVGYATALQAGKDVYAVSLWLGFLLISIIAGAAYVSLVNDVTDIEDDKASGKRNRMSGLTPVQRSLLLAASLLPGALCAWVLYADALSLALYAASYISFTLYSVPPFRLKKRGLAGVLADASGAHLFPSLLMLAGTVHFFNIPINWLWLAATGTWALMYGLRGILWHQFLDRDNDLAIGARTIATKANPAAFGRLSSSILFIELAALAVMLGLLYKPWALVALLAYAALVAHYKRSGIKPVAIVAPKDRPWHILMSSYYQALLPVSLLLEGALRHPMAWIVLGVHLLLFPRCIKHLLLDAMAMVRGIAAKRSAA